MIYKMTTINSGTRVRVDHNTFAQVLTSIPNANTTVTGSEKWVAMVDGAEVNPGDIWVRINFNGVIGWTAYIHKSVAYCKDLTEVNDPIPPPTEKRKALWIVDGVTYHFTED